MIQSVIDEWTKSRGPFSFEIRIHPPVNPSSITSNTPIVDLVFIMDVSGFYEDKECTKPIKLHSEKLISIERHNSNQEYADKLRKDLDLFTDESYSQFQELLASYPDKTYTSDPNFMK